MSEAAGGKPANMEEPSSNAAAPIAKSSAPLAEKPADGVDNMSIEVAAADAAGGVEEVAAGGDDAGSAPPGAPAAPAATEAAEDVDAELEAMKKRLQEMEQETMAMHKGDADAAGGKAVEGANRADGAVGAGNGQADGGANASPGHAGAEGFPSAVDEGTAESDARSIYVGNVDYKATGEELNEYFQECGTINRVTIMCHKATGQPKGFAYIEFKDHDSVQNALILNDSVFRGRQLKVVEKRTNVPGLNRGGFARGRPRFARGWRGGYGRRPRGRGRGRGRWAPY